MLWLLLLGWNIAPAAPRSLLGDTRLVDFWLDQSPAERAVACRAQAGQWHADELRCTLGHPWLDAEVYATPRVLQLSASSSSSDLTAFRSAGHAVWQQARSRLGPPTLLRVVCTAGPSADLSFFQTQGCGRAGSSFVAHWAEARIEGGQSVEVDLRIAIMDQKLEMMLVRGDAASTTDTMDWVVSFRRVRTIGRVSSDTLTGAFEAVQGDIADCLEQRGTTPAGTFRVEGMVTSPWELLSLEVSPLADPALVHCIRGAQPPVVVPTSREQAANVVVFDARIDVRRP